MTMLFMEHILTTVALALPRLFFVGAPILVVAIAMAAFLDTRMRSVREHH